MNRMRRAGAGILDFVIGDDWVSAAGVALGIGITAALAGLGVPAWWVMPVAVITVLGVSLRRGT